jgi:hypothetical protein
MTFNINKDEVYTIKISNGDEIVAKVTKYQDSTMVVERPLLVIPGPNGLQMMQGMFTADPKVDVELNANCIIMIAPARTEIKDSYIQATTGIQPVRNSILMG